MATSFLVSTPYLDQPPALGDTLSATEADKVLSSATGFENGRTLALDAAEASTDQATSENSVSSLPLRHKRLP